MASDGDLAPCCLAAAQGDDDPGLNENASLAICNLVFRNVPNKTSVWQCGGINDLCTLADTGTSVAKSSALNALRRMFFDTPAQTRAPEEVAAYRSPPIEEAMCQAGVAKAFVDSLGEHDVHNNEVLDEEAMCGVEKMLHSHNPLVRQALLETNLREVLQRMLDETVYRANHVEFSRRASRLLDTPPGQQPVWRLEVG